MQQIQNKNLKLIAQNTDHYRETMEQLHKIYEIETINTRFYRATLKLWNKMGEREPEIYNKSMRENNSPFLDHSWWKRVATVTEEGEPNPRYIQSDNEQNNYQPDLDSRRRHIINMTILQGWPVSFKIDGKLLKSP